MISSSGPLFGWEHGARPRSVGSWTIDWRDPVNGQTYITPSPLERGDAATTAGCGWEAREGGVRGQDEGESEGDDDADNSSPSVSAMSISAHVSARGNGRRPLGLISRPQGAVNGGTGVGPR